MNAPINSKPVAKVTRQRHIIAYLKQHKRGTRTDIAKAIGTKPSTIIQLLSEMVQNGQLCFCRDSDYGAHTFELPMQTAHLARGPWL